MLVFMLTMVALLPTSLLGILALTSRLEAWLDQPDRSALPTSRGDSGSA